MTKRGSQVVVIGAGITGCYTSYFLARCGIENILVERGRVAGQASGVNPGGLNPLHGSGIPGPMASLALESFHLHLDTWNSLAELSSTDFHGRRMERLHLAFGDEDLPGLTRACDLHAATEGFSAQRLSREDAIALEPRLNPDVVDAALTQGNLCVDGHRYTTAVAEAAVALGATLKNGNVHGIVGQAGRATSVLLDDDELMCGAIVVATGAWSYEAAGWIDVPIPVEPIKGEMLICSPPDAPLERDLAWQGSAIYPRIDGSLWLGGTETAAGFDTTPTSEGRASILDGTARIMPSVRDATVLDHVAGLRPIATDGFPLVGAAPGWQNIYLATGAGRKGILLSAAMGHATAHLIAEGDSSLSIEHCTPSRFAS
jgi:glycine oxidase